MTQVKINTKGFDIIRRALEDKYKTRVGILGSKASQQHKGGKENLTNAFLGSIHEFGSFSRNIPPRSFLRMPLEEKIGEWIKKNKDRYYTLLTEGNLRKFYVAMGFEAEKIIDEAFASSGFGKWAPDSPATIKNKGSAMPLLDTGQLRNSVTSRVMADDENK